MSDVRSARFHAAFALTAAHRDEIALGADAAQHTAAFAATAQPDVFFLILSATSWHST